MEQVSPEKIEQMKEILKELDMNPNNSSLIQDNKLIFSYGDKVYRCRMPNQNEQSLAEQAQNKFKIQLIQEDGTITRKRLIKVLKEKQDIDITDLEKQKSELQTQLQDAYLDLAMLASEEVDQIEELKEKKQKIEEAFMKISIEVIELLAPCIEEQVKSHYYKFLAYSCTEIQTDKDNFSPVWKDFEEFNNDGTKITYKAIENIQTLLLNIQE